MFPGKEEGKCPQWGEGSKSYVCVWGHGNLGKGGRGNRQVTQVHVPIDVAV